MNSATEATITEHLATIREHVKDFVAAYLALAVVVLYLVFSFQTMNPCVRRGPSWAPTVAAEHASQYFGFDQRCAAKQMLGIAESTPTEGTKTLVGQGIMVWFLGLILLLGTLIVAIGSGRRNALLRELTYRYADLAERLVSSPTCSSRHELDRDVNLP